MRDPSDDFPAIADLEHRARKRIPHFAWEYLASGTGADQALQRNLDKLAEIRLLPQLLKGPLEPDISTELFGVAYSAPIGIAPVGLTGLIWPGADEALATTAADRRIPYVLSTVATERPEVAGPNAGGMGWYQLYPPRDERIRASMLERAAESGFTALVVTADVPAPSQRERQRKARIRVPPKIGPTLVAQAALRPAWTLALARNGLPRFRGLEAYLDRSTMQKSAGFVGANLGGTLSFAYLAELRELWEGPIIVKGILDPDDAQRCIDVGADAIGVSNHGGRQLDAAPAAIEALPVIVDRVGTSRSGPLRQRRTLRTRRRPCTRAGCVVRLLRTGVHVRSGCARPQRRRARARHPHRGAVQRHGPDRLRFDQPARRSPGDPTALTPGLPAISASAVVSVALCRVNHGRNCDPRQTADQGCQTGSALPSGCGPCVHEPLTGLAAVITPNGVSTVHRVESVRASGAGSKGSGPPRPTSQFRVRSSDSRASHVPPCSA